MAGIPMKARFRRPVSYSLQTTRPMRFFATDSMKLLSLYRAADALNLTIPEQVAMAGYSDPMLSLILTPAPGGFDIPTRKLGEESCDVLFRCIAGKPAPHKILVETHFFRCGFITLKTEGQTPPVKCYQNA